MRVDSKSFYADLFSKPAGPALPVPMPETLPVPVPETLPAIRQADADASGDISGDTNGDIRTASPLAGLIGNVDAHHMSPRQMADISLDIYAAGVISFEDYSVLAFQPELHPDYDRTIGALTGETADPDRPRDFIRMWDDRAAFQRRHNLDRNDLVEQSERIASALRRIDTPTNVIV